MTDLKLCKDCKWYKKDWCAHITGYGDALDTCHNPVASGNLVTGNVKGGLFCDMMRMEWGKCGPYGKYWEARK
jgi:hypothetical protein